MSTIGQGVVRKVVRVRDIFRPARPLPNGVRALLLVSRVVVTGIGGGLLIAWLSAVVQVFVLRIPG